MSRYKKGFTLVEILVVIGIIAILSAITIPAISNAIEKTKVSRAVADIKTFKNAALQFYSDVGFFPSDVNRNIDPGFYEYNTNIRRTQLFGFSNEAELESYVKSKWNGPYIEKSFPQNPWGGTYDYEYWPSNANLVKGIWISIRTIPENAAKLLVASRPFEIARDTTNNKDYWGSGNDCTVIFKITDIP